VLCGIALAIADDHHRRRISQQFSGSLAPSQPANALLVLNGALAAWRRLERVVAGPDVRVEKTENSLRLAIDGDQWMDEKTGRNPIAGRSKPAANGLSAGEIDLGGVLRDDNPPPRGRRDGAPARVPSISLQVTDGADRKRWIASSPARVSPSLRITSDPVAVTRSIRSVPTAARRASPK